MGRKCWYILTCAVMSCSLKLFFFFFFFLGGGASFPRPVFGAREHFRGFRLCVRVWVCVCMCISHELIHKIIQRPFNLRSPHLDQRFKTPWLWSVLIRIVWGLADLELHGQIQLKSKNLSNSELVMFFELSTTTWRDFPPSGFVPNVIGAWFKWPCNRK